MNKAAADRPLTLGEPVHTMRDPANAPVGQKGLIAILCVKNKSVEKRIFEACVVYSILFVSVKAIL